jgi:SAM-dependent methyltransferase
MQEDWTDPTKAQRWTADPITGNPVRKEQLDILLTVLADTYEPDKCILDLGFGSGLVEAMIFERIPEARVIGVDYSSAMMNLADRRLKAYREQYTIVEHNLAELDSLNLPAGDYQIVVSVHSLHHLEPERVQRIYGWIHDRMKAGGLFLLLERIAVQPPGLYRLYQSLWQRQNRLYGARVVEGESYETHRAQIDSRGDHPVSLEEHLAWLRKAGFEASCLHLHANRALFAGRRA